MAGKCGEPIIELSQYIIIASDCSTYLANITTSQCLISDEIWTRRSWAIPRCLDVSLSRRCPIYFSFDTYILHPTYYIHTYNLHNVKFGPPIHLIGCYLPCHRKKRFYLQSTSQNSRFGLLCTFLTYKPTQLLTTPRFRTSFYVCITFWMLSTYIVHFRLSLIFTLGYGYVCFFLPHYNSTLLIVSSQGSIGSYLVADKSTFISYLLHV